MTDRQDQSIARKFADTPFFRHFPCIAGIVVAAVGAAIITGWLMHWKILIQLLPHLPPMKFNTALCFILCGTGLILLAARRSEIVPLPGAIVTAIGFLTLLEYTTQKTFVLDELFINDYIRVATT